MTQEYDCSDDAISCAVKVAKMATGELDHDSSLDNSPSFLATDEASSVFAQILDMTDEEVLDLLALVPSERSPS